MRHLTNFTCRRRWEGDSWSSSAGGSDRSLVPGQSSRWRFMIILSKLLPPTLLMLAAMLGKERFIWADTERPLGEQRSSTVFEKIFSPWFSGWYVPQTLSESCARSQVPPANIQDGDNDKCSNDEKWQWWWWRWYDSDDDNICLHKSTCGPWKLLQSDRPVRCNSSRRDPTWWR